MCVYTCVLYLSHSTDTCDMCRHLYYIICFWSGWAYIYVYVSVCVGTEVDIEMMLREDKESNRVKYAEIIVVLLL